VGESGASRCALPHARPGEGVLLSVATSSSMPSVARTSGGLTVGSPKSPRQVGAWTGGPPPVQPRVNGTCRNRDTMGRRSHDGLYPPYTTSRRLDRGVLLQGRRTRGAGARADPQLRPSLTGPLVGGSRPRPCQDQGPARLGSADAAVPQGPRRLVRRPGQDAPGLRERVLRPPDGMRDRTGRGQGDYQRLPGPGRHVSGETTEARLAKRAW
jgi:hypothetical protein